MGPRTAQELAEAAKKAREKAIASAGSDTPAAAAPVADTPAATGKDPSVVKTDTPTPAKPVVKPDKPSEVPNPAKPAAKKLDGSDAVKGGGEDEKTPDEEKEERKRQREREDRLAEIRLQHQNALDMERLREEAAIRRENRAEARKFNRPLASISASFTTDWKGMTHTNIRTTFRENPRAGTGVFFDPNEGGRFAGGQQPGLPGGNGITDNSNGKSIVSWEIQQTNPPKYVPVYQDGSKGAPVTKDDFGSDDNPRGTGRLGINAFSTEGRQSFIDQRLGGAKPGDANYDRTLAMAQSAWDAYSRDSIGSFQNVGKALADAASKQGIPDRVEGATRDPAVVSATRPSRDGRIGIGPRDEQGRSSLSKDWGTGPRTDRNRDRNIFGGM